MRHALAVLIVCTHLTLWALPGGRELKQQLIGTWVIDEGATLDRCKQELKAKGRDRKTIKAEQKRLSAFIRETPIRFKFNENLLHVERNDQAVAHVLQTKRAAGKMIVFESSQISAVTRRPLQMSVFFLDQDHLTLEINGETEFAHCVWKRSL